MELAGNKVLVTGGATGIGFEISKMFLEAGSKVLVCGRRESLLKKLQQDYEGVDYLVADLTVESDRNKLIEWVRNNHPDLNVVANNSGVQERMKLSDGDFFERADREIDLNLKAPIHLCSALLPIIGKNPDPVIINVSSGLAFVPMTMAPVYCSTKAALHSFTLSLRHLLKGKVEVVEVIPPAVNTDLGGAGLHTQGVPLDEFGSAVREQLIKGEKEITYGFSSNMLKASPEDRLKAFNRMNQR